MAAHFTKAWVSRLKHLKISSRSLSFSARRYLLSEAYSCQEAWRERMNSDILQKVDLNDFAVDLRSKFEKYQGAMLVDVNVFANKLQEMEKNDAEYMEDLIKKYRQSSISSPVNENIVYAIVRAYLELNIADGLIPLMKDKHSYGIFPNSHAVNLLMDHFVKENNFEAASQIAYEMMLQDDLSHPITYLLCLYSCSQHYNNISLDSPPEPEVNPDEEENWVPVKVIRYVIYDDHFDIQDERFLMGKTLYTLGRNTKDPLLSQSLQFMGLGMYQKFEKALNLLEKWSTSDNKELVLEAAVSKFEESLEKAETRDPDEPVKDMGLRTMADAVREVRITPEEKQNYLTRFQDLKSKIAKRIEKGNLVEMVEKIVKSQISKHESEDIKTQTELFSVWNEEREKLIKEQIYVYKRKEKEREIRTKLKELQEKEEILRFFENRDKIILAKSGIKPIVEEEEEMDVDTLQALRKKRRRFRSS